MIVACTGPTKPPGALVPVKPRDWLRQALHDLWPPEVTEFRTGAAFGIDTAAFWMGLEMLPSTPHVVYVPQGEFYNQDVVAYARQHGHRIVGVPGGYLKRDDAMVEGIDRLLAFPHTMNEVLRSGTWATIRRAWKRDIEVRYYPLDGKPGPVVRCT